MTLLYSTLEAADDYQQNAVLKLLLALYDDKTNNFVSVTDLLTDLSKFNDCVYQGLNVQFAKLNDYPNPFVVLSGDVPDGLSTINIDSVYAMTQKQLNGAAKLQPEVEDRVVNVMAQRTGDTRTAKLAILCCYALNDLLHKDQHIVTTWNWTRIAQDFTKQTQSWLNELNRKNTMAAISDNETKFQCACVDEFFIKLPAYDAMFSYLSDEEDESEHQELRDLHMFMPARSEVSDPYGVNTARFENPDSVAKMVEIGGQVYDTMLKQILGSSDNNTDKIFDNEKRYYDSLNEWLGIIANDSEGEDNGELCAISLEYLHTLAETLYIWYWQHNRRVPCSVEIGTGDKVDESRYTFASEDHKGVAPEDLVAFLDRVSADLGRQAYVNAIVQLARWGTRKPTAIVFDGYDKCFDLNDGVVKNSLTSLSSFDKVSINGCNAEFVAFVDDTTNIADRLIGFSRWPMPVGIKVRQTFENKTSGEQLDVFSYYSMIDAVKEIVTGHLTVDGIQFEDDKWKVTELAEHEPIDYAIEASKRPDNLQFPIFRGTGFFQIYADLHIASCSNTESHFSIMCAKLQSSKLLQFIDSSEFSTYAGFDSVTKNGKPGRKQATDFMIVRDLLKVYHLAAVNYVDGMSNSDLFSLWHNSVLESGYVDEAFFYTGVTKPSVPLPGCKTDNFKDCFWRPDSNNGKTDTVNSTSRNDTPQRIQMGGSEGSMHTEDSKPELKLAASLVMQPAKDCIYCKFVGDDKEFVSAVNVNVVTLSDGRKRQIPIFVLLDSETADSLNINNFSAEYPLEKLITHMCKVFFSIFNGDVHTSNLRFVNVNAIRELHAYFAQQSKKGD